MQIGWLGSYREATFSKSLSTLAGLRRERISSLLGVAESSHLHRGGVSNLSKSAQGGVSTIGTFDYFAGDDPTGIVFLAVSREKQTRALKSDFHIRDSSGIEGISDHCPSHLQAPM